MRRLTSLDAGRVWVKALGLTLCEPDKGAIEAAACGARSHAQRVITVLKKIASEVETAGIRPVVIILPDLDLDVAELRAALAVGGAEPYLELVRTLDQESVGARSVRERLRAAEGPALGAHATEIVHVALQAADEVGGEVVALVPC